LKYKDGIDETLIPFISYRTISIIVLSIVYILTWNTSIIYPKVFIVLGMLLSSTVGSFLYQKNYPGCNSIIIATIILESLAYSIFIILSGGFSSPYLWYFINLIIIIMELKPFGKYSKITSAGLMLLMLVCVFIEKRMGMEHGIGSIAYSDINTGIAFVVVSFGFYLLLESNDKLMQSRSKLYELNTNLEMSKKHSDYALEHTMNVYDALNIFSISNPQRVMDELNSTLYRTIAKNGCALFKMNSMNEIDFCSYEGIGEDHESIMAEFILKTIKSKMHDSLPADIKIDNQDYRIKYIKNSSNILAILFILNGAQDMDEYYHKMESKFYLYLVEIIMQELDIQSMIESYIICDEQNRIASEIHDTVIQKLFSISCNMRTLETKIGSLADEDIKIQLNDLIKSTNSAMKTLREAIYGIKWDNNHDTFEKKLSTYVKEAIDMNHINISLNLDENISILTSNTKTSLYRIICESINNSIRHSKATEIHIDVTIHKEFVTACINDNGTGFDKNTIPKDRQGIKNMYMITGVLKGTLNINSVVGNGTEILCKIPV
jgi:signal transduction histidine kinase